MAEMKNDQYYAELLNMMREQGKKDNPTILQLGVMQSANSVKIDELILYAEDLYIADYLLAKYARKIKTPYVSDVSSSISLTTEEEIEYTEGLKAGDIVAVQKLENKDMYVILARVVRA